ncbi:hypothetical protein ACNJYA_09420 [Bradyrhizobium sp. DASA03068]|uniref:hypothetical protein n=1 Tax=Bradyrhizobium sp. BLXBL-01 TaxID=3395915 RepID=UPI003F7012E6
MIEFRSADRAPEICPSSSNKVRAADVDRRASALNLARSFNPASVRSYARPSARLGLCRTHHTVIDQDDKDLYRRSLAGLKRLHEANKQTRFEISDNEADRLALFAGGMTLGTVIGVVAAGLAELFKAAKPTEPATTKPAEEKPHFRLPTRPLIHVLERIGPGKIAVAGRRPFPANLGNMFATQFALSGRWQQRSPLLLPG